MAKFCFVDAGTKHPDRLIVDFDGNREGMPVLAAVSERKSRGVAEAARRAMEHFGYQREGADRLTFLICCSRPAWAHARSAPGCGCQIAMQTPQMNVARPHIVMRG